MKSRRMLLGRALTVTLLLSMSLTVLQTPPASAVFPGANGKIAFVSNRDGNPEIYVMNADGSGQTRLTNNPATDALAAWSPDGLKIAFQSDRAGSWQWYVMNADGSDLTNDTSGVSWYRDRFLSPDHSKQANSDKTGPNMDIYVANADGSGKTFLTNSAGWNQEPAWSPDGLKIAFNSNRTGHWEIYVMNEDGSGQTMLTDSGYDIMPGWQRITAGAASTISTATPTSVNTQTGRQTLTATGTIGFVEIIQQNTLLIIGILVALIIIFAVILVRRPKASSQGLSVPVIQPAQAAHAAPAPRLPSVFCTQCGAENASTNKFCEKCGQKLLLPSP